MTSLTFYGGAGEIGGNKILLKDKKARIYLDFGQSFNFGEDYFYEYLEPRGVNGLEVYFEFDMIPKISRLYSKDMLKLTDLKYEKPDVDAVIISHHHSDHSGHLSFLDEDIPVFMGHGTYRISELYHTIFPQFFDLGEHNNLRLFKSGDELKVKHLRIIPIHVEHSVPGAYGFIIKTSKGPIAYTGDFRIHGPRSDFTKEFIKKAAAAKPYALIIEGTRMEYEPEHNYTEKEVEEEFSKIIAKSKGTVFAYFSMCNIDRFMSFYKAAVKNKRMVVIDSRLAYIIDNMREKIGILPDVLKDKRIKVYYRLSGEGTFTEKDYRLKWDKAYLSNMITYKEINKNPAKYAMHLSFARLMELVYMQPKKAHFIYSLSGHFLEGEEHEEEKKVWENWMKHFSIEFHKAHSSGHASREDLISTVKKIKPRILIPVHTKNQEEYKKIHENVILPEKGKEIKI